MNRYRIYEPKVKLPLSRFSKWVVKPEFVKARADYIVLISIVDRPQSQHPKEVMWWCDIATGNGTLVGQVKERDILEFYSYEAH